MARRKNVASIEFIQSRVKIDKTTNCWNWQGDWAQRYPRVCIDGKSRKVSHLICELINESIASGMVAMHSCDNTRCVNPNHIASATFQVNTLDSVVKGRFGGLRPKSIKTREAMSKAQTGRFVSIETRMKLAARVFSENTRKNMRDAAIRKWLDKDKRATLVASFQFRGKT